MANLELIAKLKKLVKTEPVTLVDDIVIEVSPLTMDDLDLLMEGLNTKTKDVQFSKLKPLLAKSIDAPLNLIPVSYLEKLMNAFLRINGFEAKAGTVQNIKDIPEKPEE